MKGIIVHWREKTKLPKLYTTILALILLVIFQIFKIFYQDRQFWSMLIVSPPSQTTLTDRCSRQHLQPRFFPYFLFIKFISIMKHQTRSVDLSVNI